MQLEFIDIDLSKRTIENWEKIYLVRLTTKDFAPIQKDTMISEFEWAYIMISNYYKPITNDMDQYAEKELRAMQLHAELIKNASNVEKKMLEDKYIDTEHVINRLNRI